MIIKKLKEIANVEMGLSPKGETYNNNGVGLPLLNGPTEFGYKYPHSTLYTTDSKREAQKGDIIFCVRGSTTGRMNFADKVYSLGRGVCSIRGKNDTETKYIKFVLDYKLKHLLKFANGGTFPNLCRDDILGFEVPYNNVEKVSMLLSNYDDLIENNNKRIKILEEMAQKIYKEWFVDFKFPGHETTTFKQTDLGEIPSDWEVKQIGKEYKTYLGGTPSRNEEKYWNGNIPWLNSGKTNELRIIEASEYITELGLEKSSTKLMPQYTTVLAITGATLGQVSMLGSEMCANQSVVGIYSDTNPEYVFYLMKDKIQKLVQNASGGAQQHINKDIVNEMKFVLPADTILNDFKNSICPINKKIFNLLYKNRALKQTRDLLLPRLISGEIDVENLEII